MKNLAIYSICFIGLCFGFYHLTFYAIPPYVYSKFQANSEKQRGDTPNTFSYIMAPDENSRLVVKPNPDFAYATAFFDISDGPIKIVGNMPDSTYWSVAMYEPNTINFYVKNDLQFGTDILELTLGHQDSELDLDVTSTVKKGFLLIRLLIKDRSPVIQKEMMSYLQTLQIETL